MPQHVTADAQRSGRVETRRMDYGEMHEASHEPSGSLMWRRYARQGLLLLVTGVSLYTLLPSLVAVLSSWRSLSQLNWYWTGSHCWPRPGASHRSGR